MSHNEQWIFKSILTNLLEHWDGSGTVVSNASSFPATVVARRIRLVQLEPVLMVPASVEQRDPERSFATVLGVSLFDVAEPWDELLARDRFTVLQQVALGNDSQLVGQHVSVRRDAGHAAHHVCVQLVDLLREAYFVEQLVGTVAFSGQYYAVRCQNTFHNTKNKSIIFKWLSKVDRVYSGYNFLPILYTTIV